MVVDNDEDVRRRNNNTKYKDIRMKSRDVTAKKKILLFLTLQK